MQVFIVRHNLDNIQAFEGLSIVLSNFIAELLGCHVNGKVVGLGFHGQY